MQAQPPVLDSSPSEHIYIGSDDANPDPESAARTVRERVVLHNSVRRTKTELTIYEEGFLKVVESRRGTRAEPFRLDLRYLDPVPSISRVIATRMLYATGGCAGAAVVAWLLAQIDAVRTVGLWVMLAAVAATLGTLFVAIYRSYERTEFRTIHGRAPVLALVANLGSLKRFRAFVPALSRAIEESAERIADDTSAYLRAEMREHYRLRGDGVLSNAVCAESTGRILAQFDIQL